MCIVILDNGIYMCENIVHDGHSRFHLYDSFFLGVCIIRVMSVHLLGLSRESSSSVVVVVMRAMEDTEWMR